LVLHYDFTPTAPLEGLTSNQILTDKYYVDFSALLQTA
jgi:phage tail sheath protein FI